MRRTILPLYHLQLGYRHTLLIQLCPMITWSIHAHQASYVCHMRSVLSILNHWRSYGLSDTLMADMRHVYNNSQHYIAAMYLVSLTCGRQKWIAPHDEVSMQQGPVDLVCGTFELQRLLVSYCTVHQVTEEEPTINRLSSTLESH